MKSQKDKQKMIFNSNHMIFRNISSVVRLWFIIKMVHMIYKIWEHIRLHKIIKRITINQLKEIAIVIQILKIIIKNKDQTTIQMILYPKFVIQKEASQQLKQNRVKVSRKIRWSRMMMWTFNILIIQL